MSEKQNFLPYRNHIYLHIIVFVWGFTGILGKLITLPAISLVWYRMLIAFLGLGAFILWKRSRFAISPRSLFYLIITGILIAAHWIFFFASIKVSNVSIALTCIASTSFFTALLQPLLLRTRVLVYEVMLGLIVVGGIYLIFQFEEQFLAGILYSLAAAFLAALFTIINSLFIKKIDPVAISFYEMLGGFIGITLYLAIFSPNLFLLFPSGVDFCWLLVLGLLCTALAFVVSISVMKELSPYTVTISVNMEPIYAILLALCLFGDDEKMTFGFYLGALVILFTIFANAYFKKRQTLY